MIALVQSTRLAKGIPQAFEWAANELAGNVLVHAETPHGWIQCAIYPENKRLSLVVCDRGIGIPASMGKAFRLKNDLDALQLAVKGQITSKPDFGQGNGLAGSIAICVFGGGQFAVTSGSARLSVQRNAVYPKVPWIPRFDGTMIDLHLQIDREIVLQKALWGHEPVSYFETHFEDDKGLMQFKLREQAASFGNRITGERIRTMVENLLLNFSSHAMAVDFADIPVISSSFADELFGKLAVKLGLLQFGRRIRILNANAVCYDIIERIVEQRVSYKYASSTEDVQFGADTEPPPAV